MVDYFRNAGIWLRFLAKGSRRRAREWAARLEEASQDLGKLARETEGEVLALGRRLEDFAQAAGGMSQKAGQVVDAVGDSDQMAKANDIFVSACGRLDACNNEIVSGLSRLTAIGKRLEGIFRFQRALSHLTRTVRMLRVATRMEAVRLSDDRAELGMLADEIDQFSQRMDGHVSGFFEQAAEVAAETTQLVGGIDVERHAYKIRLDEAEGATQSALTSITAILRQAADLSDTTSRRSKDVVREVGEIVSSLQFHDITRQQLEHIQTAIGEAVTYLKGTAGPSSVKQRLGLARHIIVLQQSQLNQVKEEMMNSGQRICDSLSGIAVSCQAQANDLAPMGAQDTERSSLVQLQAQMAVLAEILDQGSRLSSRMSESTRTAASLLDKMEGALHAIQSINEELNLLAMNALVKVSHQGEGGRALAEVAEAVNRLSSEPRETINRAAGEVNALLGEARDLGTIHEAALAENQQQAEAVAKAADAALQGLRRLGEEVSTAVSALATQSERLVCDINGVVGGLQFHQVVAGRVDTALAELGECAGGLAGDGAQDAQDRLAQDGLAHDPLHDRLAGAWRQGAKADPATLSALEKRYTMESERRVHRAALAPEAAAAARVPAAARSAESQELGDNVELF